MVKRVPNVKQKLGLGVSAALAVSLVFSALLTALALRVPEDRWLAWISFLPLFVAVRWLRPTAAALAGGVWGVALYLFSFAGPTVAVEALGSAAPVIDASWWLVALLIVIPAVYVGLAARAIGFKLLTLALGWLLIEAVLHLRHQLGPQDGLLTGSQGDGSHLHWLARLLGCLCMAFGVACANASLIRILNSARLGLPACRSLAGSPLVVARLPSQVFRAIQSWTLRQAHPRAPPIQVATIC